jgi:hypothetical protein
MDNIARMIELDHLSRFLMAYEWNRLQLDNLEPLRKEIREKMDKLIKEGKK